MKIRDLWNKFDITTFVVTPILGLLGWAFLFCSKKLATKIANKLRKKIFRQNERPKHTATGQPLDLSDPSRYGLKTSHHEVVTIPTVNGTLGGWMLYPEQSSGDVEEKVILYNHGVSKTRGAAYRVALYNVLLENGFKILTYDYRGFGDSSAIDSPMEDIMVEDCQAALDWLRKREGEGAGILVWGHSMGTGVTCHAMANEFKQNKDNHVIGVILESPFNSFVGQVGAMRAAVKNVVLRGILHLVCLEAVGHLLNVAFHSERYIQQIGCPVLILHAEDDYRIPISQGIQLFENAKAAGKKDVEFFKFDAKFGFNHKWINKSEELPAIIDTFYEKL